MTTTEKIKPTKKVVAGLDLNKLIKNAQESYGKKEGGLAKALSTGDCISRPTDDDDFIRWTFGDHWETLTHLKGLPFGRIVQLSGKPDSGKSSHAMAFMKAAQDQNVLCIIWDAERKFSAARFDNHMKGDSSSLLLVDTNSIIDGARGVAELVNAAKEQDPEVKILIVWDSVGASLNRSENSDETEDMSLQPGMNAREVSWAIKKFNKLINRYRNRETGKESIAVLVVNQTYANIGSVGQTEKGGSELYYLSSLIIQLSRKGDLTHIRGGERYKFGITSRAKVKKNHLFAGDESVAEMDVVVGADGIHLAKDVKNFNDLKSDDED